MARKRNLCSLLSLFFLSGIFSASIVVAQTKPWYVGFSSGYGSTMWSQLVTPVNDPNRPPSVPFNPAVESAPIGAKEGGVAWRVLLGDRISKNFAFQFEYTHIPMSTFVIVANSLYPQFEDAPNPTNVRTKTYLLDLAGKFIVPIRWVKKLDAFAVIGLAYVHRKDILDKKGRVGAVFGIGVDYVLPDNLSVNSSFQMNTGYGKSELLPADDYIPFVYAVQLGLGYHFSVA